MPDETGVAAACCGGRFAAQLVGTWVPMDQGGRGEVGDQVVRGGADGQGVEQGGADGGAELLLGLCRGGGDSGISGQPAERGGAVARPASLRA